MIDPKELRVGAHVDCKGSRYEVSGIIGDIVALIVKRHPLKGCEIEYFPSDYISPIPLTPELLAELGFEKCEEYGFVSVWRKANTIVHIIDERRVVSFADKIYSVEIRYLHELEAFVYLATKTELIKE